MDVFPGLRDALVLAVPLAPLDGFLGITAPGDAANLEGMKLQYHNLLAQIWALDPKFPDAEALPAGGLASLSWRDRVSLINSLRMQLAVTYYRVRGDAGPLQLETLRFLQNAVDSAYADAVSKYNAGRLQPRLSREEAVGNYVDSEVRRELRNLFNAYSISYGPGRTITINNRDYDTSVPPPTYRIPDARVGDIAFDWTLTMKTISTQQVREFFRADARPAGVVIVRPTQLGQNSTYLVPRPANLRPRR